MKYLLITLFTFLNLMVSVAQNSDMDLANHYFNEGEYEKANAEYKKLIEEKGNLPIVHNNYLVTFYKLNKIEEAEKYLKEMIKKGDAGFSVDYFLHLTKYGKTKDAEKFWSKFKKQVSTDPNQVIVTYNRFSILQDQSLVKDVYSEELLLESRKALGNNNLYALELAKYYKKNNKPEPFITELLKHVFQKISDHEEQKNELQNYVITSKEFEYLELELISKIQKYPDNLEFADLMIWFYIQQKDFENAFIQAKAFDKRFKTYGQKSLQLAHIAFNNFDYKNAIKIYDYVASHYKNTPFYIEARQGSIKSKEELIKSTFPIDTSKIFDLVKDYEILINESGDVSQILEAKRNLAILYAAYLNNVDKAISILSEIAQSARTNKKLKNRCKIDLADIYIIKGEPWESTLLYYQVEKDMPEDPLGYEAKFKNAKLSYFKSDFVLAQEHLDILKLATTREIANDALELSMFISNNLFDDTLGFQLKEYAAIEMLFFQNKIAEAELRLNNMLSSYSSYQILDHVYWLLAYIDIKKGNIEGAIEKLNKVYTIYPEGLLADNSVFLIADLYKTKLNNPEKAMEYYLKILSDDALRGSVFTHESRKKYRELRGDKIN